MLKLNNNDYEIDCLCVLPRICLSAYLTHPDPEERGASYLL